MAEGNIGNAFVTVKAKVDKSFGKEVEGAGAPAGQGFGSKFSSAAHSAMSAGVVALGNIISNVVSNAANAIGDFLKDTVQTGANFEKSMSQVAATMGVSVDQIQDLSSFAKEMGANTAFSASQAADALNYMALAGYSSEQAMQALPNVLNLAAAGNIDLARASDMVTDAQSALGLSMEESAVMVDQMAMAASKSNASVEQLGDAFLTVGATARSMKGGTQEMATVLGVLADNGIKGTEGGTHLRNMLLSLQDAAVDGSVSFGDFSVAIYDSEGNMRSTIDIIKDMQAGMEGMDQASKDAIISGVFNKTDLASVNALLGTSSDRFDELSAAIGDSAGAAEQMANTQLDNLVGDTTLFQSALEGVQIALFEGVSPALRGFVQLGTAALGAVLNAMNALWSATEPVRVAIANLAAGIGERLAPIAAALQPLFEQLASGALSIVSAAFSALAAVIGSVADVVSTVWDNAIAPFASFLSSTFGPVIQDVGGVVDSVFAGIDSAIGSAMGDAKSAVKTAADNIAKSLGFSGVSEMVNSIFSGIKSFMEDPINKAKETIERVINKIKSIFEGLHLEIPLPKVPAIDVDGGEAPWGIGGMGRLPSFHVHWAALGGFVDGATLIGAGEAGPEMILPQSGGLMDDFSTEVAAHVNTAQVVEELRKFRREIGPIIADYAPSMTKREFGRAARGAVVYG